MQQLNTETEHLNSRIQMYQEREIKHARELARVEERLARAEAENQNIR